MPETLTKKSNKVERVWKVLSEPPQSFYDEHPELPKIVAHLLYHRNIRTQAEIDEFLNPEYSKDVHDPFLFNHMEKAVKRLFLAIEKNEKVTIHGDYDADGVSGAVILTSMFRAFNYHNIDVFLPHRETDGYGLNMKTIELLHSQGTNVVITCDCGISNGAEVARAQELGIDVIITDHHTIPATLPPAYAIIHPKIDTETYPDKGLAGGGVAFKLLQGMLHTHAKTNDILPNGQKHDAFEKWQLDMVAIASVADMVPLIGESRTLTKYGLIVLNKTRRLGLHKLLIETRILETDGSAKNDIDADTIGFRIAPRINAAGRMEHANVAYKLLVEERATDAIDLAFRLDQNNTERQEITETLVEEALEQVKDQKDSPILFAFGYGWPTGLIGLIASRLKERFQKPTIAMSQTKEGEIVGSGRSVNGFNFVLGMQSIPEQFHKFGGHPMAGGFTLSKETTLEAFKEALTEQCIIQTKDVDMTPTIQIDGQITLEEVNWELYEILERFKPFGMANPKPKYLAEKVKVIGIEPLGKDGKHMRLMVQHTTNKVRKTVGWNFCYGADTNFCEVLKPGDLIDMIFEVAVNEWNGNRELQLTVVDLKKSI